jgi:hypothetical protein
MGWMVTEKDNKPQEQTRFLKMKQLIKEKNVQWPEMN